MPSPGISAPRVKAHDWRDRVDRSREVGVLVNATSLGMERRRAARHARSRSSTDAASSPTSSTCRWSRRCWPRARARPRHRRRPRHAAAPGGARLREMVRRAPRGHRRAARPAGRATSRGADAGRRPHRLHRHGQVDGRGAPARARHRRVRCRCRGAQALRGRRRRRHRGGLPRHDGRRQGRSPEAGRSAARRARQVQAPGGHRPPLVLEAERAFLRAEAAKGADHGGARDPAAAGDRRRDAASMSSSSSARRPRRSASASCSGPA